ncbi:MAG: DUF4743 domain-containing protein [Paraperlucidibaca sp.]
MHSLHYGKFPEIEFMAHPLTTEVIEFLQQMPRFQPDDELRLHIDDVAVGWVRPAVADLLTTLAGSHALRKAKSLHLCAAADSVGRSIIVQSWAHALHEQGLLQNWRDEPMTLTHQGQSFLTTERAAFRSLGMATRSVHLNGWLTSPDGMQIWVAERSHHKFVDPGKLDNLVGGGLASGETLAVGLAREAWEEAGLLFRHVPASVAQLYICRRIGEGLQDECIDVFDAYLPAHFTALNQDGEVAHAGLMPNEDALMLVLGGRFTWDAALVFIYGLLRQRYFGLDGNARIRQTLVDLGHLK